MWVTTQTRHLDRLGTGQLGERHRVHAPLGCAVLRVPGRYCLGGAVCSGTFAEGRTRHGAFAGGHTRDGTFAEGNAPAAASTGFQGRARMHLNFQETRSLRSPSSSQSVTEHCTSRLHIYDWLQRKGKVTKHLPIDDNSRASAARAASGSKGTKSTGTVNNGMKSTGAANKGMKSTGTVNKLPALLSRVYALPMSDRRQCASL